MSKKKSVSKKLKEGRPSAQEIDFVARNHRLMSLHEMGEALNRSEKVISTLVKKVQDESGDLVGDRSRFVLKRRSFFKQLQHQMTPSELEKFEEDWNYFIKQFKYDILPTEEYQLVSAITCTILIDRNLVDKKRWMDEMGEIEAELNMLGAMPPDTRTHEDERRIVDLEGARTNLRAAFQYNSRERIEIEKQRDAYMKALKGTRDQRIERSTDLATTFGDLIRQLEMKERQERLTRDAGLLHLAAQKEKERLAQYHTYQDGMVDQPILNSDTVMGD